MIKETNDVSIINTFLKYFNTEINNSPYRHYLVFEDNYNKGILVYSLIYDRIEIDYIYVLEEYRKNGIGYELLSYIFNVYKNLSTSLEVECNNSEAIDLYKKFNFEVVSIRKNYYNDSDGFLMVRK